MSWTIAELAYAAGLIDGEGTITIRHRPNSDGRRYHYPVVSLSNTNPVMVDWMRERFCGGFDIHRYQRANLKTLYRWTSTGRGAEEFLSAVEPFLIIKRAQARLALAARATIQPRGQRLSPGIVSEREAIALQMRALNHRGTEAVN